MVLTLDIQIFQRDCNRQSRGNQKYRLEKDREGMQGKDAAVGGEIGVSEPEQKQAGNRNPSQRNEPQLPLVWNQQIKNEQEHPTSDQLELECARSEVLYLEKLGHERGSRIPAFNR